MNTISAGRFQGLGGFTGHMKIPLSRSTVLIFSLPGKGKSNLAQSNPDAFIFNTDLSSTVTTKPAAVMWPGIDPRTGQAVNDDSRPFILTFDHILAKKAKLLELARDDKPRPSTVVIDSITTFSALIKPYITANATTLGISNRSVAGFRELHGPAAWDAVYEQSVSFISDLRNAGYGVTILAHIVKEKIPLGDDKFAMGVDFTFGSGLWKRISPLVDYSCLIDKVPETITENKEMDIVVGPGRTTKRTVTESRTVDAVYIDVLSPEYAGLVKNRVSFPRFKIPPVDGWAALEAHHAQHSV